MLERRMLCAMMLSVFLPGCSGDDGSGSTDGRGRGLEPARLNASDDASVYAAAISASFDPGPSLILLLDTLRLPRSGPLTAGEPVPSDVIRILRERGVVHGTCQPPRDISRDVPICSARAPGYVVRFSEVFRVAPDSVEVHLAAQHFRTSATELVELLSFEKAFQVARTGGQWRVAREARVPTPRS